MLPEKQRLKISRSRGVTWADKKELYAPLFKMIYRLGQPANPPKLGFIVSGKLGGSAKRNLVRRRFSEAAHHRLEKFPNGAEVVIIASKAAAEADYEEICTGLDKVLPKVHWGR